MVIRKVLLRNQPFVSEKDRNQPPWAPSGGWPAKWIWHPNEDIKDAVVLAFRLEFQLKNEMTFQLHTSADERYELYIDGEFIGRGSERGLESSWFFETYEITLEAGHHSIVSLVWAERGFKPWAQSTVRNGFLLATSDERLHSTLNTGLAKWEVLHIDGIEYSSNHLVSTATGGNMIIDGKKFPWGIETGNVGGDWTAAIIVANVYSRDTYHFSKNLHMLRPAILPEMIRKPIKGGVIRFAENLPRELTWDGFARRKLKSENNILREEVPVSSIHVEAYTTKRFIIDLKDYYCFYPEITVSGGKGGILQLAYAEALFETKKSLKSKEDIVKLKGNRDEIIGKIFAGGRDTFISDGGENRVFRTLWWRTGRYLELCVKTEAEPMEIDCLGLVETRYPLNPEGSFETENENINSIIPMCIRALQVCAHETFMDCPYYEQLMYVGDTRLQILMTYVLTKDRRLAKKAIEMFKETSINHMGVPKCAFSDGSKVIPSFVLWWVGMIYDYALWTDDKDFVLSMLPEARKIIDLYMSKRNHQGLVITPSGWNYIDWVSADNKDWSFGEPNDSGTGVLSFINLQIVYILGLMGKLEEYAGEAELASRAKRLSDQLFETVHQCFWDSKRQLYADDIKKKYYCEQTQCMAILCSQVPLGQAKLIAESLIEGDLDVKCNIFFSHYLFEAFRRVGRTDQIVKHLDKWKQIEQLGFKTTPEQFEAKITRSDCHAWGGHPVYHFIASLLGVQPLDFGFKEVLIKPQTGGLKLLSGVIPHRLGDIKVKIQEMTIPSTGSIAIIELPEGMTGRFEMGEKQVELVSGYQEILI